MSPDRLDYMANQIGRFFASQKQETAVTGIANHISKFWDPRMRRAIISRVTNGNAALDPMVREAIERLKQQEQA